MLSIGQSHLNLTNTGGTASHPRCSSQTQGGVTQTLGGGFTARRCIRATGSQGLRQHAEVCHAALTPPKPEGRRSIAVEEEQQNQQEPNFERNRACSKKKHNTEGDCKLTVNFLFGPDQDVRAQPVHCMVLEITSRNQGSELSSCTPPPPPCISYANVRNYYGPYAYCSLDTGVAYAQ